MPVKGLRGKMVSPELKVDDPATAPVPVKCSDPANAVGVVVVPDTDAPLPSNK